MSAPTEASVVALKRLGRYLQGCPRLLFQYPYQAAEKVDAYSDTDWAGCPKTRKSTNGACLLVGSHLIKSWSSTQAVISLSSGGAEFYGVVKASGIGLGYLALLEDLGWKVPLRVWTDSTATIGICGRSGLGKLRHIDTRALWIQQRVKDSSVELRKVRGECNPADLFTKHLPSGIKIVDLLSLLNCISSSGRPSAAPALKTASSSSSNSPTAVLSVLPSDSSVEHIMYHGRVFPCSEYEGQRLPEAYGHDESILPHQHEDLEERFPRAHVPVAADADEALSEPDRLEQRGEALGRGDLTGDSVSSRSGATGALALYAMSAVRTQSPGRRAMAPRAASAACVTLKQQRRGQEERELPGTAASAESLQGYDAACHVGCVR